MPPATPTGRTLPVWPFPISLAATLGITVVFYSCRYLDVSVHGVSPRTAMDLPYGDRGFLGRVPPFGHPRINGCMRLPAAFRSFLRPSSAPGAKAFSLCPFSLDRSCFTSRSRVSFKSLTSSDTHSRRFPPRLRIPSIFLPYLCSVFKLQD